MTNTRVASPADEFVAFLGAIRTKAQRIRSVDQHDTHAFVEDKDGVARDIDRAMTMFRARFGGSPTKVRAGIIVDRKGRKVVVERRRAAR